MAWWKQAIGVLVVGVLALFGWARMAPDARGQMEGAGLPSAMVVLLAGSAQAQTSAEPGKGPGKGPGNAPGGPQAGRSVSVRSAPVFTGVINDRVDAIGDGEALKSVTVVPLSSGVLAEVLVQSGAKVAMGDVLARLDSAQETIARDKAALALKTSESALARAEQLFRTRTFTQSL